MVMKSDILTFHLIYLGKENEPPEEVVFAMQGIIYSQNLPPFDKQIPYVEQASYSGDFSLPFCIEPHHRSNIFGKVYLLLD